MKKNLLLAIIAVILAIWAISSYSKIKSAQNKPAPTPSNSQEQINPPIPLGDPSVLNIGINYILKGSVKQFDKKGQGYTLVLDSPSGKVPEFPVTERTTVVKINGKEQIPATFDDVKVGSSITVSTSYNIDKKTWIVGRIYLPEKKPAPADTGQ